MLRIVGGLLICWRQIARRRGSTRKKKKKQCKSSISWFEKYKKKEDEKRKMEELHQQKVNQMIKKCTKVVLGFYRSLERRSADPEGNSRGCQTVGSL